MTFATENQHQRDLIVDLLQTMKPEAVLEVTHTVHNKVTLAAKLMSYWLELSRFVIIRLYLYFVYLFASKSLITHITKSKTQN